MLAYFLTLFTFFCILYLKLFIIYILDTIKELELIIVDNKGNICDPSTKAFSEKILEEKKMADHLKSDIQKSTKTNKKTMNSDILSLESIADKAIGEDDMDTISENSKDSTADLTDAEEKVLENEEKTSDKELLKTDDTVASEPIIKQELGSSFAFSFKGNSKFSDLIEI